MKLKLSLAVTALVVVLSALAAVAAPPAGAVAPSKGSVAVPANGVTAAGVPVTGVFTITSFRNVDGVITAVGSFTGSIDGAAPVTSAASAPVNAINGTALNGATTAAATAAAAGSCQILDLTLGPLHLDLLGLVVNLNQVHLNITAQQGPGNLLGNLLCAVTGLLDNTGAGGGLSGLLNGITNLLNQILGALTL